MCFGCIVRQRFKGTFWRSKNILAYENYKKHLIIFPIRSQTVRPHLSWLNSPKHTLYLISLNNNTHGNFLWQIMGRVEALPEGSSTCWPLKAQALELSFALEEVTLVDLCKQVRFHACVSKNYFFEVK